MSSTLTQNRLSILKSIEDSIDKHKRDNPDTNLPTGSVDAVSFLLEFYQNVQGWEFSSVRALADQYNPSLIENRKKMMSCDYG